MPPNPAHAAIRQLYADGLRRVDISRALGVRYGVVVYALLGSPDNQVMTPMRAKNAKLYKFGRMQDVSQSAFDIVRREIRGSETITACMVRLIVQYDLDKREDKTR